MSKKLKLPPLNNDTTILSFDLEANGLHGPVFAVGAVVARADGEILEKFTARSEIVGEVDPWVRDNVLPVIGDMTVTHGSYEELRQAFWQWYIANEPASDYVLVQNGYPVEYRFLSQCQEDDLDNRYWQHPFPILDLISLLIQIGVTSHADRKQFMAEFSDAHDRSAHHPVHDATVTALAAFKALRQSGQLK